jgi:pilus assembly protein CpaB
MDRRFLTVLGVSLLFALVISSVFYQMTARAGSPKKTEPSDLTRHRFGRPATGGGNHGEAGRHQARQNPASAFPKGAFSKPEEVIDRPLISNILMDEPVVEGRLAARGSGVSAWRPVIPVGMRAVTLRVNDVTGIAGICAAGNASGCAGHRSSAQFREVGDRYTVQLQNMLVLSAGTVMQPDAKGQAMPAATVTLLATPEQAETLTLANAMRAFNWC